MLGIYKPLIQDETDFLQQLSSLLAFIILGMKT